MVSPVEGEPDLVEFLWLMDCEYKVAKHFTKLCCGILEQSMGARNRAEIGLAYRTGLLNSFKIPSHFTCKMTGFWIFALFVLFLCRRQNLVDQIPDPVSLLKKVSFPFPGINNPERPLNTRK
jgi:hypothetical protein